MIIEVILIVMNMIITIMILIVVKERVVLKWGIRSERGTVIYLYITIIFWSPLLRNETRHFILLHM